ncbi:MAG: AbrB/MazE/SpoVT family DNA-binding domain-containing protein [Ignavibacteria bacterium]|nr:AbrB/MazE/SpoVT family DNA-binding domain-containing protein [Ignavibacteria bacterium]
MKTQVIKIGNSRGIRIPKSLLEQSGLGKEVDIEVREDELIVRSIDKPRKNWAEGFRAMAEQKDDTLLDVNDSSIQNRWDKEEWDW